MVKNIRVKKKEIHVKTPTQILRYSPVFLINSIIEREETFENNSGSVVTDHIEGVIYEQPQTIHNEVIYTRQSIRHHKPSTEDKYPLVVSDRA